MPRLGNLIRCTWVGTLPNGEMFNTSLWLTYAGTISSLEGMQAISDTIKARWDTHARSSWQSLIPSTCRYTELRCYRYASPGPGGSDLVVSTPIDALGSSTAPLLPLPTSLVITLHTLRVGRSGRGRMYLPMVAATLLLHQLPDATIEAQADAMAAFLTAIDAMELPVQWAVVSSPTSSDANKISRVSVDSEPDVQRRRTNRQTELHQADATVA